MWIPYSKRQKKTLKQTTNFERNLQQILEKLNEQAKQIKIFHERIFKLEYSNH